MALGSFVFWGQVFSELRKVVLKGIACYFFMPLSQSKLHHQSAVTTVSPGLV